MKAFSAPERKTLKVILTDIENPSLSVSGDYRLYKKGMDVHSCTGCFGCWTKTPGKCLIKDDSARFAEDLGKCTELIIISRCVYGGVSPFVKKMQDRGLPSLLPFFLIRNKEMHHKKRYGNRFALSALFYGKNITEDEKQTAKTLIERNALNYDAISTEVRFFSDEKEIGELSL